jgi:hypothetical protein
MFLVFTIYVLFANFIRTLGNLRAFGIILDRIPLFAWAVLIPLLGRFCCIVSSVADPDPNILGHPDSGSRFVSQRYGSGSGSFYYKAKIIRNLDSYCFLTY